GRPGGPARPRLSRRRADGEAQGGTGTGVIAAIGVTRPPTAAGTPRPATRRRPGLLSPPPGCPPRATPRLVQRVRHPGQRARQERGFLRGYRPLAGDLDRHDRHRRLLECYQWPVCAPPSTCTVSPVTNAADSRHSTAWTISGTSPIRPNGCSPARKACVSSG